MGGSGKRWSAKDRKMVRFDENGKALTQSLANRAISATAGALADAATRSVIDGTSFGDNLIANLPNLIGNIAGKALADAKRTPDNEPGQEKDGGLLEDIRNVLDKPSKWLGQAVKGTVGEVVSDTVTNVARNAHAQALLKQIAPNGTTPEMRQHVKEMLKAGVSDRDVLAYFGWALPVPPHAIGLMTDFEMSLQQQLTYVSERTIKPTRPWTDVEISVVRNTATSYLDSTGVDWEFIRKNEGADLLTGYVPSRYDKIKRERIPIDSSGVTISTGLDLGQHNFGDLKSMKLPDYLIERFEPYLSPLRGKAAMAVAANLRISLAESRLIEALAMSKMTRSVISRYDSSSEKVKFADLTQGQKTVLIDFAYQYGAGFGGPKDKRTLARSVWQSFVKQDWGGVRSSLHNAVLTKQYVNRNNDRIAMLTKK